MERDVVYGSHQATVHIGECCDLVIMSPDSDGPTEFVFTPLRAT